MSNDAILFLACWIEADTTRTDGLSEKLRVTLKIADGESIHPTVPLIDQGVDSLGAGTIGTWFSKQLYLDLPLLKVLGGASVSDLADEAAERLSVEAIPLVVRGGGDAQSSEGESSDDLTTPSDGLLTTATSLELSSGDEAEDDDEGGGEKTVVRRQKLSLTQEYSWRLQSLVKDLTVFNNTIGMFMKGSIDLDRLAKAFRDVLQRHEAFRTGLAVDDSETGSSTPQQIVFKRPNPNTVQILKVADRAAAKKGNQQLKHTMYNLVEADALRLVDYHWGGAAAGEQQHLLVVAYQRLFGDGSTTENLFVEAGQLYAGATLAPPSAQFAYLAARQRRELESGGAG